MSTSDPLYLLDTNGISDAMDQHPVFVAAAASAGEGRVVTSTIVRGEILFGIERLPRGRRRERLTGKAARVLGAVPTRPVDDAVADHYARLKADRQRAGKSLDENDLWVAATALALGATLVTRDTDFHSVRGLSVVDWTKSSP